MDNFENEKREDLESITTEENQIPEASSINEADTQSDAPEQEAAEPEMAASAEEEAKEAAADNIFYMTNPEVQNSAPIAETKRERRSNRHPGLSYLASALIGSIIGGIIVASITPYLYGKILPYPSYAAPGQKITINASDTISVAGAVAKKVMPSVVRISTVNVSNDFFFGPRTSQGVGSGVVVNSNGYILTNAHVVGDNPQQLTVYLQDGREMAGNVLYKDASLDIAVVKINATGLQAAELGDSDVIDIGETAIAIGNPLGTRFERSVTQGIISGLNRSVNMEESNEIMEDLIQTDAAINPGNSGGPLINSKGQVVGINTIKASAEGLGFAIPINITKPIINKLIADGKFEPAVMGIVGYDREIAGYYENTEKIKNGIYLYNVSQGSAAEKAGLKAKDIILQIDGKNVDTMLKLKEILYSKNPGDKLEIKYQRAGKEYTTTLTLLDKQYVNS